MPKVHHRNTIMSEFVFLFFQANMSTTTHSNPQHPNENACADMQMHFRPLNQVRDSPIRRVETHGNEVTKIFEPYESPVTPSLLYPISDHFLASPQQTNDCKDQQNSSHKMTNKGIRRGEDWKRKAGRAPDNGATLSVESFSRGPH